MNKRKGTISLLFLVALFLACLLGPVSSDASAGTITGYEKIHWGVYTGRYYVNGVHAFCAAYSMKSPGVGTKIATITPCDNQVIRKALYYGYNGPGNVLGTDAKAHVLTAIAISDANIGVEASGIRDIYHEFYYELVSQPEKYPSPPWYFHAYLARPQSEGMQTLAFYEMQEIGYVSADKVSSDEELTRNNPYYSLEGAEYGIYHGEVPIEGEEVARLIFNADGKSNQVELAIGSYYAKELKAPKGFKKSNEIFQFEVAPWKETTLTFVDEPIVKRVDVLIQKVDATTGLNEAQGMGSLRGAQFKVQYYKGTLEAGKEAERTWLFKTDEKGQVRMQADYLVEGDALYETLPLGIITVREIKASKGYLINEDLFQTELSEKQEFQPVIVREEKKLPYDLVIHKKDDYGNLLEDAEFALYADCECAKPIACGVTDEAGVLRFENLEAETHYYLKEISAPAGYSMMETEGVSVYEIYQEDTPTGEEFHMDILNEAIIVLPKTGSAYTFLIPMSGVILCIISLYFTTKKRRTHI